MFPKLIIPFFFLLFAIFTTCSTQIQIDRRFLSADEMGIRPTSFEETGSRQMSSRSNNCYAQDNYLIDTNHLDHYPMQYLRVNFHWTNSSDSSQNIPEAEAIPYTEKILYAMNYALENNKKMWLPPNNDTPVHPVPFRFVLTGRPDDPADDGIYYHYDDELYYYVHYRKKDSNLYTRDVFDRYGVQLDTVLNIFLMPHQKDSIASPTYRAGRVGVALSNAVKVAAPWIEDYTKKKDSYWRYRGVINHEIGHILNLSHAWTTSDGCDDTPKHPNNCWNKDSGPGCDTMASNNLMDYSALQLALTPDQIARMSRRLADRKYKQHNFLEPRWCLRDTAHDIVIRDTVDWRCLRDLYGNLTIAPGGQLTIRCSTSVPANGKVSIQPGGKLILEGGRLYQDCGESWQGIEVEKQGELEGILEMDDEASIEDVILEE
jgi:hypothetical protein